MTTWPIVNDLNHYKKWDTYESIRNEKWTLNNEDFEDEINFDYWTSEIFSNEEIEEVMNLVLKTYDTRSINPQVSKLYYAWDEKSSQQLDYFKNEIGSDFKKCLQIYSNFHIDWDIDETDPETIFFTNDIIDYSWTACKYEWWDWELVNHWFM